MGERGKVQGSSSEVDRLRRREEVLHSLQAARARRRRQRPGSWGLTATLERADHPVIAQRGPAAAIN